MVNLRFAGSLRKSSEVIRKTAQRWYLAELILANVRADTAHPSITPAPAQ
jgi:hypothetical protein